MLCLGYINIRCDFIIVKGALSQLLLGMRRRLAVNISLSSPQMAGQGARFTGRYSLRGSIVNIYAA